MQKQRGLWYFHKMGKSYRDGTYKGLDLAFGQGDGSHGGILLRAMVPLEKKGSSMFSKDDKKFCDVVDKSKAIIGPCNLVNKILELNSKEGINLTISQLVDKEEFSLKALRSSSASISGDKKEEDIDEEKQELKQQIKESQQKYTALYLEQYDQLEKLKIYSSPRVGLSLKRMDKNKHKHQYIMKSYRYFTHPELIHKGKNLMAYPLINQGLAANDIALQIGAAKKSIDSFVGAMEAGKKSSKTLKNFENKSLSNDDLAQLYGVWSKNYRDEIALEEEEQEEDDGDKQQLINI